MKKLLSNNAAKKLGLGVAVLGLALGTVGCGSAASNPADGGDTDAVAEDVADEEVTEEEVAEDSAESSQLLWEDSDIKVSYIGTSVSSFNGQPEISLQVENNSDMAIDVSAKDISINNYLCYDKDSFVYELAAGESETEDLLLSNQNVDDLMPDVLNKISDIKTLEMDITVSGSETGEVFAESQPLVITFKDTKPGKPLEIDSIKLKSEMSADEIKSMYMDTLGEPFAECNGVKFYYVSAESKNYGSIYVNLIVDNTSDNDFIVDMDGKTLNGAEYTRGYFEDSSTVIPSGKRILTYFSLTNSAESGINATTDIKDLKATVEVKDGTTKDVIATADDITIPVN
jgi:hypothetical protein